MRVTLTVIKGPHLGAEFAFDQYASFVVGRHRKTQFRLSLKDPTLSRFHFLIEMKPAECSLLDLNSRNHTFLNGRPVTRAQLRDGDVIKAGKSRLQVAIEPTDFVPEPVPEPADPPEIPGFQIERPLGRGKTGAVYLAADESDRSRVALKLIAPEIAGDPLAAKRVEREALIHRQLEQRHIASLYRFGRADRQIYLVMEYVPGVSTLALLQQAGGRLPVARAVDLVRQALDALAYTHSAGVVHRDIKPSNLLVTRVGGRDLVKVVDFGLARIYHESNLTRLTLEPTAGGSIGFMCPEQIRDMKDAGPPADIYSAGATLYVLLTGMYPYDFPAGDRTCLDMVLRQEPIPILDRQPDLPEGLASLVHRAMSREPSARPDARALQDALAPWANGSL
jgi:serine/threonine-protein kinase